MKSRKRHSFQVLNERLIDQQQYIHSLRKEGGNMIIMVGIRDPAARRQRVLRNCSTKLPEQKGKYTRMRLRLEDLSPVAQRQDHSWGASTIWWVKQMLLDNTPLSLCRGNPEDAICIRKRRGEWAEASSTSDGRTAKAAVGVSSACPWRCSWPSLKLQSACWLRSVIQDVLPGRLRQKGHKFKASLG